MVRLFMNSENICSLDTTEKFQAIKELTQKASVFNTLTDLKNFQEEVFRREQKMSTGIGKGIAVAHGEYSSQEGIKIALGISREGILFDAVDNEPVHALFLIGNPPGTWAEYLNILASIVRMVRNDLNRNNLLHQHSPEILLMLLRKNLNTI